MSIADELNANRACSAPWIKGAVLRPVTLETPKLRAHAWVEEEGEHVCAECGVMLSDAFVKDFGPSEVVTATSLDVAIYWWTLRFPRTEVAALVRKCREARG